MDDDMEDDRLTALEGDLTDPNKLEREGTPSSIGSSPEQDIEQDRPKDSNAPPLKRKGGRKPIYATSEERKQRNRQAQAAFRERRTEYIKTLELQLKQNEETLATLQQNHRSAADECLMLRYKNSLLERILLEKGIDVQAELQIKAGSPTFPASMMQAGSSMPHMQQNRAPLQRTAVQRHHARRSANIMTNNFNIDQSTQSIDTALSPQAGPTPSSHTSSPSNVSMRSPITMQTGSMTPPTSAHSSGQQHFQAARSQQHLSMLPNDTNNPAARFAQPTTYTPRPGSAQQQNRTSSNQSVQSLQAQKSGDGMPAIGGQNASTYYPSPFQKHIDQLEQEYDTQDASQSMLDQLDHDPIERDHNIHAGYSSQAGYSQMPYAYQQQLTPHSQNEQSHLSPTAQLPTDMIDPNDPLLDADPFGLTASMHYPTSYSFEHHQARR